MECFYIWCETIYFWCKTEEREWSDRTKETLTNCLETLKGFTQKTATATILVCVSFPH